MSLEDKSIRELRKIWETEIGSSPFNKKKAELIEGLVEARKKAAESVPVVVDSPDDIIECIALEDLNYHVGPLKIKQIKGGKLQIPRHVYKYLLERKLVATRHVIAMRAKRAKDKR